MTIYCKIAKWITDLLINIGAFYWHDYCHHCPKLLVFNGVITEEGMAHFGGNVIKEISQQLNCSAQKWWFLTTAGEDIFPLKKMSYYFHKSPLATLVIDLAFWWYPFSRGLGIITAKWCAPYYGLFAYSHDDILKMQKSAWFNQNTCLIKSRRHLAPKSWNFLVNRKREKNGPSFSRVLNSRPGNWVRQDVALGWMSVKNLVHNGEKENIAKGNKAKTLPCLA